MKRIFACVAAASRLSLFGCFHAKPQQYSVTYYDVFDTVTTLTAQADSKAEFDETAEKIHAELLEYHELFDIFKPYPGIINLYIVNQTARIAPVKADSRIIDLLLDCKQAYEVTDGKVNAAMGAVLQLWYEARNAGLDSPEYAFLPSQSQLDAASQHIDFNDVIIDEEASTVYFADPHILLDVGAIAKGWAAQKVVENAPDGWLLSVGGNVCATGPKADGSAWNVAIQDPLDPNAYLHTLSVSDGCVVTSGDYQRTYIVDGKSYHHIIDPNTLYPASLWHSVTVVCNDSGIADILSTAPFLMDQESGQMLLDRYGAKALWMDVSGNVAYSPGFEELIRK